MTSAAHAVGIGARMANFMFGNPSVSRANGMREASVVPPSLLKGPWANRRRCAPAFVVDKVGAGRDGLPRVWVTEPAYDARFGRIEGRELVGSYPNGADPQGRKALALARAYFSEALGYSSERDRSLRVDCFRAAELLYLHALARGSVEASLKLGCLYAADLCEGRYWGWDAAVEQGCRMGALPLQALAFERFSFAAVRGNAEACWQLGDMVLEGRGCAPNASGARMLYLRSYELARMALDEEAVGNAALRLARLCEQGLASKRDLKAALAWYRLAFEALDQSLAEGAWHYKRAWHETRTGVRRMQQELCGGY